MDKITLEVTEAMYATAKDARKADRIPMVYYGKGFQNRNFSVDYQTFRRAYKKGGRSTIMYLHNEKGEEFPVLVKDVQYDPVTDATLHIDLKAVDLNKAIRTKVPIVLKGIPLAVKDLAGILVQNKDAIEIECLPKDLVHEFELDVTSIADFHTSLTVKDIKVPPTIKVLDALNINVATVAAPRAEEEEAAPAAAAAVPGAEGAPAVPGAEGAPAVPGAEGAPAATAGAPQKGAPQKKEKK